MKNFRNYTDETIDFTPGINVIFGRNAQGKTNCAEAVYYLCTGTSPRTRRDKQMIQQGSASAEISVEAQAKYGTVSLWARITETGRELRVNGNKITRNADILGNLYSVFFSPHELRLIQDGPDERRRFLNVSISQLYRPYYIALARYNKILEQRNNLLKNKNLDDVYAMLPVWDEQLCQYAAIIISKRKEYLEMLGPHAKEAHAFLTDGAEELDVFPERKYAGTEGEIAKKLYNSLSQTYDKDIRLGFTGLGPHRDDIGIEINGTDAKTYASQGQTRTAALSIKLAEVEIFTETSGESPVLVLDDVMSELDLPRRKMLVRKTDNLQCLITCTHAERALYGKETSKIRIENGSVVRKNQPKREAPQQEQRQEQQQQQE
ncbi:MAG: DNA replication/repair protein RecF [Clostridia bacterium]|nr:DNA replication/repair protein RecF [Clostridia bacterium]